uniref:ORC1/DEAH AAA+ ATPase domain-containing protein n=1 Tax=Zooxanthella nutricula TaxID=1333877 RepID=A0A6U6PIX8_9DINO|mmetsp:Transcript_59559/g.181848  ORF Transcript_59559/g.181848 Transcript_59559/m.181848 type:complete len:494 (+) Transcript_59559:88-1569(+)
MRTPAAAAGLRAWLERHADAVRQADDFLAKRLADPKVFGEHTNTQQCDEVFSIVKQSLGGEAGDHGPGGSSSVLLLGEARSGKTHVVEWCINQLREAQPRLVVLRAYGMSYSTDIECVRHLVSQVAGQLPNAPRANASFESGMEWLRAVLTDRFQQASAAVIVLDRFEYFCSRARQTLLYNLFDIAQEVGVHLSIIGMSERMDVMGMLEKRIKSRFSMRHLHSFLPTTMEELVQVLMSKLRLPARSPAGLAFKGPLLGEFHRRVEAALRAKSAQWQHHLELGRAPSWFLWQCVPVAALLHDAAAAEEAVRSSDVAPSSSIGQVEAAQPGDALRGVASPAPPAKRLRLGADAPGCLPSASPEEVRALLLSSLSETEHIVLLALFRRKDRQASATLALVFWEVQRLHEEGGLVAKFVPDNYCAAFDRLVQMRLVEVAGTGSGDPPLLYQPCHSLVHHVYTALVVDLESSSGPKLPWNPLRGLPQIVQRWSARQRQ